MSLMLAALVLWGTGQGMKYVKAGSVQANNWLLNPTGNPNSWVEIDLMQEHLNYWIKVSAKTYKRLKKSLYLVHGIGLL